MLAVLGLKVISLDRGLGTPSFGPDRSARTIRFFYPVCVVAKVFLNLLVAVGETVWQPVNECDG